jgi:hypothetical protein
VVELCNCEALSSKPTSTKNKQKTESALLKIFTRGWGVIKKWSVCLAHMKLSSIPSTTIKGFCHKMLGVLTDNLSCISLSCLATVGKHVSLGQCCEL